LREVHTVPVILHEKVSHDGKYNMGGKYNMVIEGVQYGDGGKHDIVPLLFYFISFLDSPIFK
jgi:hypothetical protein